MTPSDIQKLIFYTEHFIMPPGIPPYVFREVLQNLTKEMQSYTNPIHNLTDNQLRNYLLAAYPSEPWRFARAPSPLPSLTVPEPRERIAYDLDAYKRPPEPGDFDEASENQIIIRKAIQKKYYAKRKKTKEAIAWGIDYRAKKKAEKTAFYAKRAAKS